MKLSEHEKHELILKDYPDFLEALPDFEARVANGTPLVRAFLQVRETHSVSGRRLLGAYLRLNEEAKTQYIKTRYPELTKALPGFEESIESGTPLTEALTDVSTFYKVKGRRLFSAYRATR